MARPLMQVVAEQQKQIAELQAQNRWLYSATNKIAAAAGLRTAADDDSPDKSDDDKDSSDDKDDSNQPPWLKDDADKTDDEKKEAARRRANFRRQADETNPANPIPDPSSEAPFSTTEQARQPGLGRVDVTQIGAAPGATGVAADTTTTVDQIGGISADQGYNIDEDVTKPVSGTEGPLPLDQVRTVPEIQFGNPLKPDAAFPLQGDWANKVSLGSQARTYASLRLARLRMESGIADPQSDDLVLGEAIQRDASITDGAIYNEIETLTKVVSVKETPRTATRRTQPVERTTPSFTPGIQPLASIGDNSDDGAFLFE